MQLKQIAGQCTKTFKPIEQKDIFINQNAGNKIIKLE